jgi:hypothetical protein
MAIKGDQDVFGNVSLDAALSADENIELFLTAMGKTEPQLAGLLRQHLAVVFPQSDISQRSQARSRFNKLIALALDQSTDDAQPS